MKKGLNTKGDVNIVRNRIELNMSPSRNNFSEQISN